MKNLFKEPSFLKVIIPISAAALISRAFPQFSLIYYLFPPLLLIILFSGYKYFLTDRFLRNFLLFLFLFGLWAAVTSVWSDYPVVTLTRAGYFILISFGAVIAGYMWRLFDFNLLSFLLPANILVVALSLFSLITGLPVDAWTGGNERGFMSFAGHQNTLASAILFTLPAVFFKIRNPEPEIRNSFIYLLLLFNLLILLLTYSRASMLSLICGVVVFIILNKKWNLLLYSSSAALLIFLLIWFLPSLNEEAEKIIKKDFPAFYSTREWMWIPSYNAALHGGLTGLGYGVSHPEIIVEGTGSYYNNGRYIREKGNSFLALIEEVGLIGLILFLLPLAYIVKGSSRFVRDKSKTDIDRFAFNILISSLAAFIIHSQFEAWIVGVGSIQLPLFFFYAGSIASANNDHLKTKQHLRNHKSPILNHSFF